MRRLCVGDIHGCYDILQKVLDTCKFSDSDTLYSVGDFTDRGPQNVKVLDFLMSLKNFKPVVGNHDFWNYQYLRSQVTDSPMNLDAYQCWDRYNGGRETLLEEMDMPREWKEKVYNFLKDIPYTINLGDKVIVHTVCSKEYYNNLNIPLEDITMETLMSSNLVLDDVYDAGIWDRDILKGCKDYIKLGFTKPNYMLLFEEMYRNTYTGDVQYIVGHTPLAKPFYDRTLGIIGIDTGAVYFKKDAGLGIDGCLTILDIDSLEYWQSSSKETKQLGE